VFTESHVEGGGVRLRYVEAGQGSPLVHLSEPGAHRPTPAHELLASRFRVILVETPAESSMDGLADAVRRLGLEAFDLVGTWRAAELALRLALQAPDRVRALVLEAPSPIRDADLERRLPDVAAPTLLLVGTRDVAEGRPAGRLCKERIAACHLVYVYDATRAIAVERPEAFAEVVADFLDRHAAFVISRARTVIHP
jgi:pimeloyl-ACP methyl ester carboxylesterase